MSWTFLEHEQLLRRHAFDGKLSNPSPECDPAFRAARLQHRGFSGERWIASAPARIAGAASL